MFGPIRYRKGYKYQLSGDVVGKSRILPAKDIDTEFIVLTRGGNMTIRSGYSWDGASGPTIDSKKTMTPSLIHDCYCQLIRNGHLGDGARKEADKYFFEMLREKPRKMWLLRAKIWYRGVRIGAKHKQKPKKVYRAA
jgi:hypothetical protein